MIPSDVKFIMNGANHKMDGISAYPFNIFGKGWDITTSTKEELPFIGDTIFENDVWIGQQITIMPRIKVGNGAIITTNSTVTKMYKSFP